MTLFYKNMNCNAFSYAFLRENLELLVNNSKTESCDKIIDNCIQLFRYYRNEVGGRYDD